MVKSWWTKNSEGKFTTRSNWEILRPKDETNKI